MNPILLLSVYCLLIILASIAGGLIPLLIRPTHTRLQLGISLTAGFMLGIALLHMIPHALLDAPAGVEASDVMLALLGGFLTMFFIERFFSFHTHEVAEVDEHGRVHTAAEDLPDHDPADHAHHHGHVHPHQMIGQAPGNKLHWTGAAIGLTLHSVLAGIALGAAVFAAPHGHEASVFAGLAVFLVIVLHKPLDALTVITLTASAGYSKFRRHAINGLFALAVPVGVGLFLLGLEQIGGGGRAFVTYALAFSAGTLLCIALSDLLPELHFHSHDRTKLSIALLLGLVLAYAMATAEHAMHDHGAHGHGHDHGDHDRDDHIGHDHADEEAPKSLQDWLKPDNTPHDSHEGHDHSGHDHSGHDH
jgi:zinc and cadmium transporter